VLKRTLVIGRRWNVVWDNLTSLYLPDHVTQIAERYGQLHIPSAVDYFIIGRMNEFPWEQLPDVVIARRGYDNYLVMMAVRENVSVVDVTRTLVAVHQTDSEAKTFGRHRAQKEFNMKKLGNFVSGNGITTSAQFMTLRGRLRNARSIVVVRREAATKSKMMARKNRASVLFVRKYVHLRSVH